MAEFKQVDSAKLNKVEDRIIECEKQKANLACIKIPETMDFIEAAKVAKKNQWVIVCERNLDYSWRKD